MKTFRFKQAAYFFYECCCKRKYTICYDDHSGEYTLAAPVRQAIQTLKSADVDPPLTGEDAILLADTIKQALNELEAE